MPYPGAGAAWPTPGYGPMPCYAPPFVAQPNAGWPAPGYGPMPCYAPPLTPQPNAGWPAPGYGSMPCYAPPPVPQPSLPGYATGPCSTSKSNYLSADSAGPGSAAGANPPLPGNTPASGVTSTSNYRSFENGSNVGLLYQGDQYRLPGWNISLPDFGGSGSGNPFGWFDMGDSNQGSLRVDADYLLLILKPQRISAPVAGSSTNPNENFALSPTAGSLVDPSVKVAFGEKILADLTYYGFRLSAGVDPGPGHPVGAEINGLYIPQQTNRYDLASNYNGTPSIVTFFYDTSHAIGSNLPIGERAFVWAGIVGAVVYAARFDVVTSSQVVGGETNLLLGLADNSFGSITGLVGFRYLSLADTFTVDVTRIIGSGSTHDDFATLNNFYGGQIGVKLATKGRISLFLSTKLAMGDTQQTIDISGYSVLTPVAAVALGNGRQLPGGFFTNSGNIGVSTNSQLALVSDSQFGLKLFLTDRLALQVAYNYLYWTNVVRAGDQIQHNVNSSLIPNLAPLGLSSGGAVAPTRSNTVSDFWSQGLSFGVELRF